MENLERFIEARTSYRAARVEQRTLIVNALENAGFSVKNRGRAGRGKTDYTSGGRLNPPYDLSDWLWVQAQRDGITVIVTLQVLDQDPHSLNMHVLMDRIGVEISQNDKSLDRVVTTQFELPLTTSDVNDLLAFILREIGSPELNINQRHLQAKHSENR